MTMTISEGAALPQMIANKIRGNGHSQVEAGREMGVSGPAISRWLSGKTYPEDGNYAAIARYLGISVAEVSQIVHSDKMSDGARGLGPSVAQLREDLDRTRTEFLGELAEIRSLLADALAASSVSKKTDRAAKERTPRRRS